MPIRAGNLGSQGLENFARISINAQVHRHKLAYFGCIYVYMNHFGLTGISRDRSGHPVVETHTHSNEQVTFIGFDIRSEIAVHSEHTLEMAESGRQGAQSEKSGTCRYIPFLEKIHKSLFCPAHQYALTEDHERPGGLVYHSCSLVKLSLTSLSLRHIAADEIALGILELGKSSLRILGKVQHHRSRTTCTGNVECPCHCPGHVFGTPDLIIPFGNRSSETYDVGLLKCVRSERTGGHLSRNHHNRGRIGHCVGYTRDDVGRARTGGNEDNSGGILHPCIALGRVYGSLLVADEYMPEPVGIV